MTEQPLLDAGVLRVIDANLNRLREALRVVEEYFRFINSDEAAAVGLKQMRHSIERIESGVGRAALLAHRDTETDPFARENRPEELTRNRTIDVLAANLKRAQEAARVLEEYVKLTDAPRLSEIAKTVRFDLYLIEKNTLGASHP